MPRRFQLPIAALALAAAFVPGLAGRLAAQTTDTGSIVGQVSISRGGVGASRIKVTLETRGAIVNEVWTDNEGRFSFSFLPGNVYHLVIDDERYLPYRENVQVNPTLTRINIVNPTLMPRPSDKPVAEADQVSGGNPYVIDAAYLKQFPKRIIKEFEAGVRDQESGKLEPAIRHFQKAISQAPDFYPAHNNLGTAYLSQGQFALAQAEFETVLRLNQSDTQAYFNLGNVLLLTNRLEEARRVLEEGIRRQPQASLGHFLLGTVLVRGNQAEAAERELRKAQALDPLAPKVHLELVNLYLQGGRKPQAIAELKLFLARFPQDPLAPRAREVLTKLEAGAHQ